MKHALWIAALVGGCGTENTIHQQVDGVTPGAPTYGDTDGPHSTHWYIFDDLTPHETHSSSDHVVDYHGDPSLYWYEPSGANGMIGTTDSLTDFTTLRSYIVHGAGGPTAVDGPLSFSSDSVLETFEYATFTYILCDFWVDPGDDPSLYRLSIKEVDDGVLVLMNEQFVDYVLLGHGGEWSLDVIPGQTNSIVMILVDDSADDRYLDDAVLTRAGAVIN